MLQAAAVDVIFVEDAPGTVVVLFCFFSTLSFSHGLHLLAHYQQHHHHHPVELDFVVRGSRFFRPLFSQSVVGRRCCRKMIHVFIVAKNRAVLVGDTQHLDINCRLASALLNGGFHVEFFAESDDAESNVHRSSHHLRAVMKPLLAGLSRRRAASLA